MCRSRFLLISSSITLLLGSISAYAQTTPKPGKWTLSSVTYLPSRGNGEDSRPWPDKPRTVCMSAVELTPSLFLDAQKLGKNFASADEQCDVSGYKSEMEKTLWKMLCKKDGEETHRVQFEVRISATKIHTKIIDHIRDPISGDVEVLHEEIYKREGDCDEAPLKVKK
jgi:hypothetical protein